VVDSSACLGDSAKGAVLQNPAFSLVAVGLVGKLEQKSKRSADPMSEAIQMTLDEIEAIRGIYVDASHTK
jgi:hypothetical protein